MGDRSGNIRWWDVTTGQSSAFNSHRDGIRRIKFSPVVAGDRSRGRVAVLFNDNTFSVFDLVSLKRIQYFPSIVHMSRVFKGGVLIFCNVKRKQEQDWFY